MRDGEQPLDQRQPAIQIVLDVGVVDLEVDRLLLDGRGILVGEQHDVRADPGAEASELAAEVERTYKGPLA